MTRCVLFDTLFGTNSAPILLIDPENDGSIVDANTKAAQFYGYSREAFRSLHVWDINTLDRSVLPVMREISSWDGGHYPQRFRHRLADGTIRDVQVYAGPVELVGRRFLLCIIHDVTAVIEVEQFNRLLLESVTVGVCGIDPEGRIGFVNPEAVRAFGCQHESELNGLALARFLAGEEDGAEEPCPVLRVAETGVALPEFESRFRRADGAPFPVRVVASPIRVGDGVRGAVVSFIDLTREREREDQIADLINSLPGIVFQAEVVAGRRVRATYFNSTARSFLGVLSDAELTSPHILAPLLTRAQWRSVIGGLRRAARSGRPWESEFAIRTDSGDKWLLGRAMPRRRAGGSTVFNGVLLDISDRKRLELRLEEAALVDSLTGVWNRRRFEQVLAETAERFSRHGRPYTLIVLDIDHFKNLNDQYGHDSGDETLKRVAAALGQRVRRADCLARWGGEEFAVLLPETGLETAGALAEDLRRRVAGTPVPGAGRVTVSLGVGEAAAGEDPHALFRRVDAALYRAKANGRNQVELG